MKVYVFGKYEDRARVRRVQGILRDAGHTITHDWTIYNPNRSLVQDAIDDTEGVRAADLGVGVFIRPLPYEGSFGEFGMSIISGKPVIVIGRYADNFVFSNHPLVIARYPAINDFLKNEKLFKYAGEVRIKEVE